MGRPGSPAWVMKSSSPWQLRLLIIHGVEAEAWLLMKIERPGPALLLMPEPTCEHLQVKQSEMPFTEAQEDRESQCGAWKRARNGPVVRIKKFISKDLVTRAEEKKGRGGCD